MLTTLIIILREVLEASIFISLLLALHLRFHFHRLWLPLALLAGITSAWLYAASFAAITEWFEGSGQEVINGFSLLCVGVCLFILALLSAWSNHRLSQETPAVRAIMTACAVIIMIMAIAREGAEIIVYYSGLDPLQRQSSSMIVGGIIGAGLGICLGILVFTLLYQLNTHNLVLASASLITLITAGVASEATQYFIQAGWILTDEPLWDMSPWISESSVAGQLLYAVFAYEATPTREEVIAWSVTFVTLLSNVLWLSYRSRET